MKFTATALAILTFGAAVVSTSAGSLRRNINNNNANYRRHLIEDMQCVLFKKDIQFEDGTSLESWSCELSQEQAAASGGVEMVDIVGLTREAIEAKGALSGETIMKAKTAYVEHVDDADNHVKTVLHVSEDSEFEVEEMDWETDVRHVRNRRARRQRHRNLADSSPGTLKVLVVRTIDSNDIQMAADALQLKDDVFDDAVCIKTQYAACSHDQLVIEQATEFSTTVTTTVGDVEVEVEVDGIVDVKLDIPVSSGKSSIESAAFNKATSLYGGGSSLSSTFDLVMFCQPPGSGSWVAYAYINDYRSYYNNYWCQRVSAQMHEVGHNFGLAHSGRPGMSAYSDKSGMMGFSYNSDDGPKKCFNAAKSYQLGWYEEQTESIDPLSFVDNPQTFVMNGVADYKKDGSSNAFVSLRLENKGIQGGVDYYIGYNRKIGANSGTDDVPNTVTLVEKDNGPNSYGPSRRLAAMTTGQSTRIQSYGGTNLDIFVTVDLIDNNGKDATITISTSIPDPTEAPTSAPTQSCDDGSRFQLGIQIDKYGAETAWKLTNNVTNVVVAQSQNAYASNTAYVFPSESDSYCLPDGCYTFLITDSYGDGLCCSYGQGYFRGYLNGDSTPIFDGGQFGASDTRVFCVDSSDAPAPTTPPVVAPTSPPTNPPTAPPTNPPTVPPTSPPTAPPTNPPTVPPTSSPTTLPPTGSPTDAQSSSPTSTATSSSPSESPIESPTSGPAESPQQCVDDPLFRWQGVDKKDCDWIKKVPKKTINKCKRFEDGIKVYEWCPEACATANIGPCTNLYVQVVQV